MWTWSSIQVDHVEWKETFFVHSVIIADLNYMVFRRFFVATIFLLGEEKIGREIRVAGKQFESIDFGGGFHRLFLWKCISHLTYLLGITFFVRLECDSTKFTCFENGSRRFLSLFEISKGGIEIKTELMPRLLTASPEFHKWRKNCICF